MASESGIDPKDLCVYNFTEKRNMGWSVSYSSFFFLKQLSVCK